MDPHMQKVTSEWAGPFQVNEHRIGPEETLRFGATSADSFAIGDIDAFGQEQRRT